MKKTIIKPSVISSLAISAVLVLFLGMFLALSLAFESAGRSMAARMAIMAITTSSSIKVNAVFLPNGEQFCESKARSFPASRLKLPSDGLKWFMVCLRS